MSAGLGQGGNGAEGMGLIVGGMFDGGNGADKKLRPKFAQFMRVFNFSCS